MAKSPSRPSRSEPDADGPDTSGATPSVRDAAGFVALPERARPHRTPGAEGDTRRPPVDPEASITNDDCIRVAQFHDGKLREWRGFGDLRSELRNPETVLWVDLTDPAPQHVSEIARLLGLHPLVAEDILEGNQRAKIEVTDKLVHIVMFALMYEGEMLHTEIDFVLGDRFLLTVHERSWDPHATSHLREGLEPIMARGPDHLLWALVDALVDSYFPFIDRIGDEVDEIEDDVVTNATPRVLARLFALKKDLITARRAAAPVREIFNQLTNRDLALIDHDEVIYFRDVYDHLIRLTDELDNYRELASGALDVYLSTVNNNLSLIMKRLTGVTVILAGIGAVAGIFGMSEAGSAFVGAEGAGFWLVTGFTVLVAFSAAAFLRKIGWI
jgi:magnesium transporter